MLTSDRDAYQLVTAGVTVLAPQTGGQSPLRIGPDEVIAHRDQLSTRQNEALADPLLGLYRRVATMDAAAPLTRPLDASLDRDGAQAFAADIGANRLAERLASG